MTSVSAWACFCLCASSAHQFWPWVPLKRGLVWGNKLRGGKTEYPEKNSRGLCSFSQRLAGEYALNTQAGSVVGCTVHTMHV
ncbi:hypothetical protein EV126DRAFT_180549 [Verticillium dahliae]|nr:hypothetical protein EV126DRAFT_180549 [Verticillium dahliae]